MKQLFVFLIPILLVFSSQIIDADKISNSEKGFQEILIGRIDRSDLLVEPFGTWFEGGYADYAMDNVTIDVLPETAWENLKISVILATWCPDSRREVPRFFKILDYAEFPDQNLELICVNREKTVPDMNIDYLDIQFVPTMIFFRENKEIGRIIESPEKSLEKDIAEILTN
ncbi:MAG: thioredoxin family protein [Bacteroidales bacterium]|nr:MAG: thioredoxin family protein [Bacteroidales bacterium]